MYQDPYQDMSDGPIHTYFSLSYSNYLVLHRTMLQQMPQEWQEQFVSLVEQMTERFKGVEKPACFIVQAAEEHIVGEMNAAEKRRAGVTSYFSSDEGTFYDKDGNELDRNDRVMISIDDPIPHYRRAPSLIA